MSRTALPAMVATAADGDHVVVRWRVRGTHLGAGLGMPATGRPVNFRGMTWLIFKDGVIIGRGFGRDDQTRLASVQSS